MGTPAETCLGCGYDVSGLPGESAVCSECGAPIDRTALGRAESVWRRRRVARWAAMTAVGLAGALAGLTGSCLSVGLVTRGDWALPGAGVLAWCVSALAVLWVRRAATPPEDRARRRARSVAVAAALGLACTGATVLLAVAALMALVPFPSPD